MSSYSALTTLDGRDAAEALAAALEGMDPPPTGIGVFEIEDGSGLWEVGAYFDAAPDAAVLLLLATAFTARPFTISEIPEVDWVAKVRRDLAPVTAGRFFVFGSHDADKVPPDVIPLQIEATVAFGTGHHGTTLGCLRSVDWLATSGAPVTNAADIGTGTGVLALAVARVWPQAAIIAADIDEVAVEVAQANAAINALADRVPVVTAAGFAHPELQARAPYDLILANILKGPLIELAPAMAAHAALGGRVVLSGLLVDQAPAIIAAYEAVGLHLIRREDLGDWATLIVQHQ